MPLQRMDRNEIMRRYAGWTPRLLDEYDNEDSESPDDDADLRSAETVDLDRPDGGPGAALILMLAVVAMVVGMVIGVLGVFTYQVIAG